MDLTTSNQAPTTPKYNLLYPILAVMNVNLGFLFFDYNLGIFNTVLPYLQKFIFPTASSGIITFIASAPIITGAIAATFTGFLTTKYGRKNVMIASDLIAILGVCLTLIASLPAMIIGRLLIGLNIGCTTVAVTLYFTEISPAEYRGPLSSGISLSGGLGLLLSFSLGILIPTTLAPGQTSQIWRILLAVSILFPLFRIINFLIFFKYDTPTYLVSCDKLVEAKSSVEKIYREGADDRIKELIKERDYINSKRKVRFHEMFTKKYRKALLVCIVMLSMQHLCGFGVIMVFSKLLFGYGVSDPNSKLGEYFSIGLSGMFLLSIIPLVWSINRFNRKTLLVPATFFLGLVGVLYGVIAITTPPGNLASKIVLLFWPIPFNLCMGSVINVMVPETLPEVGVSISFLANWIFSFLTVQFFPNISKAIGVPQTFLIFGGLTIASSFYFWISAVETKNQEKAVILQKYSGIKDTEDRQVEIVNIDFDIKRIKTGSTDAESVRDTDRELPTTDRQFLDKEV